jgi:hypothetical protein
LISYRSEVAKNLKAGVRTMIGRCRGRGHQLAEVRTCRTDSSTGPTYLTEQLLAAVPYLADAGWHQTAKLLTDAATEIERLQVDSRGQRD